MIKLHVIRYHRLIDLDILRQYAIITSTMFALFAILPILWVSPACFGEGIYLANVQTLSLLIFVAVLLTSMMGTIFHHLVHFQPRFRNAFAFVFSISAFKMLVTILVFEVLGKLV